jgi:uncharacterized membrane protein
LAAAASYGAADFLGGVLARRSGSIVVVFVSQAAGFVPIAALLLVEDAPVRTTALLWGGLAGLAGGTGVGLLYRGLAVGRMSVVAPVTGVIAAVAPVVFGLIIGERPGAAAMAGVLIALIAVLLVSGGISIADRPSPSESGLAPAFVAGAAFGAFFIFLERAGDDVGLWPVLAARAASTLLFLVAALVTKTPLRVDLRSASVMSVVGVLDVAAIVLYVLATREGLLSLVAVLTSMYPAMTVLLARAVLKERFVRPQMIGLGLAGAGIALIALG